MSDNVRITRANARSFAQISLDRSMSETLGQELFDVRRIARIFRTAAKSVNVGLDLTDIRNIRRDAMEKFKKLEKAGELTEDDLKIAEKDIQKLTDEMTKKIDALYAAKEKELMEV